MCYGYTHMAFAVGSEAAVDELTERLRADGYKILSGPRVTGDGYYETSLLGGHQLRRAGVVARKIGRAHV